MSEKTLWRVRVQAWTEYGFPKTSYPLVMARDGHEALDKVKASLDGHDTLYDEEIQRDIVDGVMNERTIERNYSSYINQVDYIE